MYYRKVGIAKLLHIDLFQELYKVGVLQYVVVLERREALKVKSRFAARRGRAYSGS